MMMILAVYIFFIIMLLATHSMVVGFIIRRALLLKKGLPDPMITNEDKNDLLRLIYVIEKGLKNTSSYSAIEWMTERKKQMNSYLAAMQGHYYIIGQLCSVIENGTESKNLVDYVVNQCEYSPHSSWHVTFYLILF